MMRQKSLILGLGVILSLVFGVGCAGDQERYQLGSAWLC